MFVLLVYITQLFLQFFMRVYSAMHKAQKKTDVCRDLTQGYDLKLQGPVRLPLTSLLAAPNLKAEEAYKVTIEKHFFK